MKLSYRIENAEKLSDTERKIGEYILKHMDECSLLTMDELAGKTYTSKTAVNRFCRKIGLPGYRQLRVLLAVETGEQVTAEQDINVNFPFEGMDDPVEIAHKMRGLYEDSITDTFRHIDEAELMESALILRNAGQIDIYTHAHNIAAALVFKDRMITIGRNVNIPMSFYEQRAAAAASDADHAAIIISYSGRATFIPEIAEKLAQQQTPSIMVGRSGSNHYPQYISHSLIITGQENLQTRIAQFSSHIGIEYLLDVIYGTIFNLDRQKNEQYIRSTIGYLDDRKL